MAQEMYTGGIAKGVRVRNLADTTQGLLYPYLLGEISFFFYFIISTLKARTLFKTAVLVHMIVLPALTDPYPEIC